MVTPNCHERLLNESVIINLIVSLKSLDVLGHSVAAAHVDAAIQSLKNASDLDFDKSIIDAFFAPDRIKYGCIEA